MKNILTLLVLLIVATAGLAQQKETCRDVVYLTNGSVFRGKIIEYQHDGELIMESWSGGRLRLPAQNVKKIDHKTNQTCFEPTAVFQFAFMFEDIADQYKAVSRSEYRQ